MQSRFEFLEEQFPKLASCGKKAEEALDSDNNICLLNLGRIAEIITEILCRVNNIEKDSGLLNSIDELEQLGVIDENIKRKIKTLLEIKDEAEENNYDSETACEHLMTTAQELCEWFAIKQFENKFEFLAELFPPDFIPPLVSIAELGREAEENLFTNTRYCLICLGDIGEAIADYLINANSVSAQRDHLDRINVLFNLGIIQDDKKDELHNLRIARNNAVHERYTNTYTSEEEAKNLLEEVLKLCRWLFKLVLKPGYIVKGRISEINEDSISVLIGDIPAQVPLSEIPTDGEVSLKDSYIKGKKYIFKVLENENDNIILSLLDADREYNSKILDVRRKYSNYKAGQELKAKIIRISNSSGALVELKNGLLAQIPPSEIVGRKLYSCDSSGTKHIKYDVTARVKYISPTQYPPMMLTLKDVAKKKNTPQTSKRGSDNKAKPPMKNLAFLSFCRNSAFDKILRALDNGANPNASNNRNLTALMEAAKFNHHRAVKVLLDYGANVNAKNHEGNTALHFAAMQNGPDVIEELIKHGADIEALNKKKKKPVDYARANIKLNNYPNVMELLTRKAPQNPVEIIQQELNNIDIEKTKLKGTIDLNTQLKKDFLRICRSGSSSEIAEAIAEGVNVNSKNKALSSALMFAARSNTAEAVSILIEAGAYIDAQDIYGNTALIYASSENNDDVVELLIDAGADIELTNTAGFSAYDYGRKNYRLADTEALKKLGVRSEE